MREIKYNEKTEQHESEGIPFDGHFAEWKLEYTPETYLKESELSGDEWRKGGEVKIHLNGDCVLKQFCRTEDRAITLLSKGLYELKCFFELWQINGWKENLVGQKVYHAGVPSVVDQYCGDGEVILKTEDGKPYEIYGHKKEEMKEDPENYDDEWMDKDRVHITDPRIYWHRQ